MGSNPDDWEADFPDWRNVDRSAKFQVSLSPQDMDQPLRWEQVQELGADDDDEAFYSIAGNFNSWTGDRMAAGDVPGLHTTVVEIPRSGRLEFRFWREGDEAQIVCPATPECSRITEGIIGPAKDLTNSWVIEATPGKEITIELLICQGRRSVMWLV